MRIIRNKVLCKGPAHSECSVNHNYFILTLSRAMTRALQWLRLLRDRALVPSTQLGMVRVYFLPLLEWGLEEARTVSELFPARAPAPVTGPGTGRWPGDVSYRKKGRLCSQSL